MASTGLVPLLNLPLFAGRQTTGAAIPAAATTGTFGCTVGTIVGSGAAGEDAKLVSEVANNNTKTDTVIYDVMFPLSHFCGDSFTLSVRALHTRAAGAGTVSIDAAVRVINSSGQTSADLCSTAAQTLTAGTASFVNFTIDSTDIDAGARLLIAITAVVTAGDANNNSVTINSIRLGA